MHYEEENDAELSSDDEDYKPTEAHESSDEDDGDIRHDEESDDEVESKNLGRKKSGRKAAAASRVNDKEQESSKEVSLKFTEEEKKHVDDLWYVYFFNNQKFEFVLTYSQQVVIFQGY